MHQSRITKIEWARLEGLRPRKAGCNARLGDHGQRVATPITRITTGDGSTGFGWSRLGFEQAQALLNTTLADALVAGTGDGIAGVAEPYRAIEYPLLDLAAKRAGKPVYALVGDQSVGGAPLQVPCYDTSLYMDEFHLTDDTEAVDCIAGEASQGLARGHRHFKIKVGRGAMHMPLESGTVRDIAVIHAVREVAGPDARLMIDANNGYNLNLTKRVLAETAGANVYWMEEPFHEDPQLYGHLKDWLAEKGIATLIADGEGDASAHLLDWVERGLIDVVQYDVRYPGFSRWLELGPVLDAWGAHSAPHNYGEPYGNYVSCHLAPAIRNFEMVEWDAAKLEGLDGSAYTIAGGLVTVPDLPGFGLDLDDAVFAAAVRDGGFSVS